MDVGEVEVDEGGRVELADPEGELARVMEMATAGAGVASLMSQAAEEPFMAEMPVGGELTLVELRGGMIALRGLGRSAEIKEEEGVVVRHAERQVALTGVGGVGVEMGAGLDEEMVGFAQARNGGEDVGTLREEAGEGGRGIMGVCELLGPIEVAQGLGKATAITGERGGVEVIEALELVLVANDGADTVESRLGVGKLTGKAMDFRLEKPAPNGVATALGARVAWQEAGSEEGEFGEGEGVGARRPPKSVSSVEKAFEGSRTGVGRGVKEEVPDAIGVRG
ncbi:MAG: hypothetical protein ACOC83_10180 [Gemmatimonadota bacterium]